MGTPLLHQLTPSECMALLSTVPFGRVGITLKALPVVLPVNFVLLDDDVVFRAAEGTRFHAATVGAVVAFEADWWAPSGCSGWSVVVQGQASVVTDPARLRRLIESGIDSWASDGAEERFVGIAPVLVTGRRFVR